ncbi:ABC transporter ATP-binding protein [Celerinatantimonas yamalensis]|uniref:Sn-glycerol-3-phosphate ABC transporter ATP-binding protein UgpC n=1 Tax=Celerinatantimonas yamalensis TaxID=559956 RepID=A0ABW9G801_9GAMM
MSHIELSHLRKQFGKTTVVDDFNLTIDNGEFVVLVGPSGCGKSTTLRMVAGLESISHGQVMIDGQAMEQRPPHLRNIAMVFQNYALYPHMSVRENICFGLKKSGASTSFIQTQLKNVSQVLQLNEYLERRPAELSGGQRQRVAMGRALARDAKLYLFDEPLSNLDAKLRHHMRSEIARLQHQYQMTALYVTHDQTEAMTLGDRVIVMREGKIEQVGSPMELYLYPANTFVASFIGSPAINLLPAKLSKNHLVFDQQYSITLPHSWESQLDSIPEQLLVGIRPEFLEDARQNQITSRHPMGNYLVELIEQLGFDQEVTVTRANQQIKARLTLHSDIKVGQQLALMVDPERILLFDPTTGQRLIIH